MARPRLVRSSRKDEPGKFLGIGNRKANGRSFLLTTIRGTSVGRSTGTTNGGWRRTWLGQVGRQVEPLKAELRCSQDCCAAVVGGGNSKYSTAAMEATCHDTVVMGVEGIGV